jgi:hypothetical protein
MMRTQKGRVSPACSRNQLFRPQRKQIGNEETKATNKKQATNGRSRNALLKMNYAENVLTGIGLILTFPTHRV